MRKALYPNTPANWGVRMCPSRPTVRTQAFTSCSQATLDIWSQIQNRRLPNNRCGYLSATYNDHPIQNTIRQQPTEYSKDTQCYGDIPTPIDETSIWSIIGGNVNGIKPYVDMGDFLKILERLRALQVGTIAFSQTTWNGINFYFGTIPNHCYKKRLDPQEWNTAHHRASSRQRTTNLVGHYVMH
jgi:hypothetical protein